MAEERAAQELQQSVQEEAERQKAVKDKQLYIEGKIRYEKKIREDFDKTEKYFFRAITNTKDLKTKDGKCDVLFYFNRDPVGKADSDTLLDCDPITMALSNMILIRQLQKQVAELTDMVRYMPSGGGLSGGPGFKEAEDRFYANAELQRQEDDTNPQQGDSLTDL